MATDMKDGWGELSPGDIVIAHDDFALMLSVTRDGWPDEWMWLGSGIYVLGSRMSRGQLQYLFEGRAILRPDGQVLLCQRDRTGWNEQALEWWRATAAEAGA